MDAWTPVDQAEFRAVGYSSQGGTVTRYPADLEGITRGSQCGRPNKLKRGYSRIELYVTPRTSDSFAVAR
jgi:hypothetical protein